MISAAAQFRKSGFNDKDAATLATVAAQYQNIADTAVSAESAAASITSQIRAFGEDAEFATTVINAYNEVANRFSIGTNDIASAMEVASSGMATYGNKFSEIIGLVTAGTEIMQGRSLQVARGLSTIASRIVKNQDALAAYGITVENVDGSLKSTFDVLSELKPKWDSMTDAQRTALGDTLAGTNQYKVLAAVLQNFEHATAASETALNSAGSAAQENAKYLESLEAREQSLKAEFEDFANRVLSKDVVAGFYNAGEAALKFINTDFGAAATRITGTTAAITSLVGILGTMGAKLTLVGKQLQSFGAADGLLGLLTTPKTLLIIGGVVASLVTVAEVLKAVNQAAENRKFENLVSNYEELKQETEEAAKNLEEVKKKLQDLQQIPDDKRGEQWHEENEELKILLQYYEQLERARKSQSEYAAQKAYSADREVGTTVQKEIYGDGDDGITSRFEDVGKYKSTEEAVRLLAEKTGTVLTESQIEKLDELGDDSEKAAKAVDYLRENLELLGYRFTTTTQTASEYQSTQGQLMSEFAQTAANSEHLTTAMEEQRDAYIQTNQGEYEYLSGLKTLTTEQQQFINGYQSILQVLVNTTDGLDDAASIVEFLGNRFGYTIDEAFSLAVAIGAVDSMAVGVKDTLVTLADGTIALKDACVQGTDGAWQLKEGLDGLAESGQDAALGADAVSQKAAEVAKGIIEEANAVDTTTRSFQDLVAQEILFGNNGLDITAKLESLRAYAKAIGATQQQLAMLDGVGTVGGTASEQSDIAASESIGSAGWRASRNAKKMEEKANKVTDTIANNALSIFDQIADEVASNKATTKVGGSGGGSSVKKSIDETADYAEEKAKEAAEKAAQEAEQAAQEAAEKVKEQINEAFDALKEAEEAYWDDKIDALETQNKLLDRQTQLEEKLKALQEAKQKRILLYKDGRFQYSEDVDKISSAQYEYDETYRNIYIEEQKEILNDLKDKALALIEEYRDAALENGELNKENISALLDDYRALGDTTYQTIAYGVDNITNLIASGMSAISGASTTIGTSVTGTMNTIGSAMTKMTGSVSSAAGLLNKQFGDRLSAIQGAVSGTGVGSIGGSQSLSAFRDKHWGETTGKFNKLSLLYGGGQAWWMGMMSKYLEDPEKNANLQIGTKDDGSPLTLKELYETDWAKEASKMDSVGGIEDYIQRAQAKSILSGGTKADYDALNKIAQDAYREAYFRNPRTIAPSAKWYGGYDPKFSAAQYAIDAALRYSGSTHDVFDVEGAHTSGMSAGRVSDLKFLEELVEQGKKSGASGTSQTQAVWAKSELEKRYQTSYKSTVDAIDKQIAENSQKWYTASDEEKERLHLLNEELRKNRSEYANKINKNASGTTSSRGGLSLVGEEGPELRVLNRGDGVLPTDVTNNLWRWGSMTPSDMLSSLSQKAQSLMQAINISNVTLPNVRDAQSFISGLKELAQQYVTRRN